MEPDPRRTSHAGHETVLRCTDVLVTAVQNCIGQFTSACLSKGLISEEVERYTLTSSSSDEDKARRVVSAVRGGIKIDPSRFDMLMEVMEQFRHLESEVGMLRARYNSISSHLSPRVSSSSLENDGPLQRISSRASGQQFISTSSSILETDHASAGPPDASVQQSSVADTRLSFSRSFPENDSVFETRTPPDLQDESAMETDVSEEMPSIIPEVVGYIRNLKNVRAFGVLLKIESGKLDEIENAIGSRILLIVEEWFSKYPMTNADRWEELGSVLLAPAVDEPMIASKLKPHLRRGSSVDSAISVFSDRSSISSAAPPSPYQVSYIESIGNKTEECSEANVLNCLAPYSEWYEIGVHLHIQDYKLKEIRKYPPADQKAHLVALWYRLQGQVSWIKLKEALARAIMSTATSPEGPLPYISHWTGNELTAPYEQEEVEEKLGELQEAFSDIQQNIMDILEVKGVRFKQLKRVISSFPAHVQMNSFKHIRTVSGGNVEFEDIFSSWNHDVVWSFLDFALLEGIVRKYGSDGLKDSMREYSSRLKDFRKRTIVSRLMCIWSDPNVPEEYERCKTLIANLNIDPDVCTLEKLEVLRKRSSERLLKGTPLSEAALVLFHLKRGSLLVTWIVRPDLVQKIRDALVQCVIDGEYFKENDIISLELDGKSFVTMESSLLLAAEEGVVKKVDGLLDNWNHKNHNINETNPEGKTALILAAAKGHESVVCSLLEMGDKVNTNYQMEDTQWSALFFASEEGHEGVVKLLLEYGADKNLRDRDGRLADILSKSMRKNVRDRAKDLLKSGKKIVQRLWGHKKKLLSLCEIGDYESVKDLLEVGPVDVDVRDSYEKRTPLMWACENGHFEIVKLLLQRRADVNLESTIGWTALHFACSNNFVRIAYLLLRNRADPDRAMENGVGRNLHYTALMYISDMDHMEPMARALLKHNANIEIPAAVNGWTPLIQACHFGKEELVKLYLDYGAEVNRRAGSGWTAIMAAARVDRGDIARLLIEKEASLEMAMTDAKKRTGESAIHIASYMGSINVVPVLIACGADPNVTNKAGLSPLMIATKSNNVEIVKALCQSKTVDVNLQQKSTGLPPLFLAAKNGHVEIFKILLEHGAADEVNMGGQIVSVLDVVRLFKKSKKNVTKLLERHKLERRQRPEMEMIPERLARQEKEQLGVAEKIMDDYVFVEDVKHPAELSLQPPNAADGDTGELPAVVLEKEGETTEESVVVGDADASAPEKPSLEASKPEEHVSKQEEPLSKQVAPAEEPVSKLEEPLSEQVAPASKPEEPVSKQEKPLSKQVAPASKLEVPALKQEPAPKQEEPAQPETSRTNEKPSDTITTGQAQQDDEPEAKDSDGDTSSLFEAEDVYPTTQKQETPKWGQSRSIPAAKTKQESSQAEKLKLLDRFILSRFDIFAASWKLTQDIFSCENQEHSGKGVKPVEIPYSAVSMTTT